MDEDLCNLIREAFAGVTLGDGVGLMEAQAIDDREDEATRAAVRASDEKEDWSWIPPEKLNRCFSSPAFFDPAGMRFHLPAYLIAYLQGQYIHDAEIPLVILTPYNLARFALLSRVQREAIRSFLLYLARSAEHSYCHENINRALESFWID